MKRKIFIATSWKNKLNEYLVDILTKIGHEVYSFKHIKEDDCKFNWDDIPEDKNIGWTYKDWTKAINSSNINNKFICDKKALDWCDTCVLLLPSGRSSHLEAGYCIAKDKPTFILLSEIEFNPELMYLLATKVVIDIDQLIIELRKI